MELKNLNDVSIYIAPLCDDNLTWQDLTVEAGFINAFTTDKNRPYLEDKVYFVYNSSTNTKESLNRFIKFSHLDTLHSTRYVKINNKHYTIYCFCNPKYQKDINRLKQVGKTSSINARLKINRFWNNVPVPNLAERLFYSNYRFGESIVATVPEEDYYGYDIFNKYS